MDNSRIGVNAIIIEVNSVNEHDTEWTVRGYQM
jgi:hypothetical protein